MSKHGRTVLCLVCASIAVIAIVAASQRLGSVPNKYAYHDNEITASADHEYASAAGVGAAAVLPETDQLFVSSRQQAQPTVDQSMNFTITLQPGWNAVYLPIQPEANDVEHVLDGIEVGSVWSWNQQSQVSSPPSASDLEPGQADWLAYFPPASESSSVTNLFAINGGRSYLIELDGDESVDWVVTGQAVLPSSEWLPDSYNLVGFHVDPNTAPTFKNFFASAPAISGQPAYRMAASGTWDRIDDLAAETIQPGEAYWMYSAGPSDYSGPLSITLEQSDVLDFGKVLDEQTLRIRNASSKVKRIVIGQQGDLSYLAYWGQDTVSEGWLDFPGIFEIRPHEELSLQVAVRRNRISDSTPSLYHSALEISDGEGLQLHLPVAVESLAANRAGLWVGTAILNQVNQPTDTGAPDAPKPTGSEFQIRLIVHVHANGQATLLQQVTLMWKEGIERADPEDPTKMIVEVPGRFVLVTRDDLLDEFAGAAMRDGKPVGRRISSAAFSFREPVTLGGDFGSGQLQSGEILIGYNDPLNPFKHKYHPNHDNLYYDFTTVRPEGKESFTVRRNIELEFSAGDGENPGQLGWGTDRVGGIYRETIRGVHKDVLYVAGTFELQLVSTVGELNDGR